MHAESPVRRTLVLVLGAVFYAAFLVTFVYAIGFVGNLWTALGLTGPWFRSMDIGGPATSLGEALLVDALLLGLFAVQHSVMARAGFKRWWTRVVPHELERSIYVLAASVCLGVLFWQWRPIGTTVLWDLSAGPWAPVLVAFSAAGFLIVFLATLMINHFDLFGLRQVWTAFRGQPYSSLGFTTPAFYKAVRHPIYLGFIIAFWATPVMTLGHLLFAGLTTGYILVAIQLEERDLVRTYGDAYLAYRQRVAMLLPFARPRGEEPAPGKIGSHRATPQG